VTDALTLPTKRDEAFRYSDIDALATAWPVAVETIIVAANENWSHHIINTAPDDDVVVRHLNITLSPGSRGRLQILNAGGRLGRFVIDVALHDHSDFYLDVVQVGGGNQTLELVTTFRHLEPNAASNQQVRSILGGSATGSYLGKVAVSRDAQHTSSIQSVKAMLLTHTATANAKPELEIYADDVKCAHGATVGELDKNALFYLAARGLPPAEAQTLLLQAFVSEVFEGAAAQGELEAAALAALGRLG
jgi:Fe-S cluster assembly protein SufD